jgi:hypothetical protein
MNGMLKRQTNEIKVVVLFLTTTTTTTTIASIRRFIARRVATVSTMQVVCRSAVLVAAQASASMREVNVLLLLPR